MASLGAMMPEAGSANWRGDRAIPGANDRLLLELRVRHVVIRETAVYPLPKPHVVYRVDVMTQSDQWSVYRRFSEFHSLQQKLTKRHGVRRDLLPSKRITGNMDPDVIERRRDGLERFLQRLINSDKEVVYSRPLLDFLEVQRHNVVAVTNKMAVHFAAHGDAILADGEPFHMTPTQCRCVDRRLTLPMHTDSIDLATRLFGTEKMPTADITHVYDFVYQVQSVCVHPRRNPDVSLRDAPIEQVESDVSFFNSVTSMDIDHCAASGFSGLSSLRDNLAVFRCRFAKVKTMRELIRDAVAEKRPAPKPTAGVESWRSAAMGRFVDNRVLIRPWKSLVVLDLSDNLITKVDPSCLELTPCLQELVLHHNQIADLNAWLIKGLVVQTLARLDLAFNDISALTVPVFEDGVPMPSAQGSSIRLPSPPSSPEATRKSTGSIAISPAWSQPLDTGRSLNEQTGVAGMMGLAGVVTGAETSSPQRPTTHNMAPPGYSAQHLISTDHPDASLATLQQLRAQRMSKVGSPPGEAGPAQDEQLQQRLQPTRDGASAATRLDFGPASGAEALMDGTEMIGGGETSPADRGGDDMLVSEGPGRGSDADRSGAAPITAGVEDGGSDVCGTTPSESLAVPMGRRHNTLTALRDHDITGTSATSTFSNLSQTSSTRGDDDHPPVSLASLSDLSAPNDPALVADLQSVLSNLTVADGATRPELPRADSTGDVSSAGTTPTLSPHPSPILRRRQPPPEPGTNPALQRSLSMYSNNSNGSLPMLGQPASTLRIVVPNLTSLCLRNSWLGSLHGVERLSQLRHLDVRYNRLAVVSDVSAVVNLPVLEELLLEGNKIAQLKNYRAAVTRLAAQPDAFTVDGRPATAKEMARLPEST